MSYSSSRVRKEWTASDDLRDAGLTTPDAVIRYDDISYGPDPMNVLDVYRPKDTQGSLPVFVLVHGGGWVYGDKERYQYYGLTMAERGFAVINYTYRLAPEYKFPASLEDTCLAIRWMFENKQKYGFDTEHVFLGGDSAGAHLAGLFTNLCTSPEYAAHFSFRAPEGFVPNAVALNCGVYAPARGIDELIKKNPEERALLGDDVRMIAEFMEDLLPDASSKEDQRLVSVYDYMTSAWPPVFLMTAHGDYLMEAAPEMERKLKALGVPCTFKVYGTPQSPEYHDFHVTIQNPAGQKCNDDEAGFFRSFL